MEVEVCEHENRRYHNKKIKHRTTEQKLSDETLHKNENEFSLCIEVVPPDRSLPEKFCEKGMSIFKRDELKTQKQSRNRLTGLLLILMM
jgi:hypothetical protein